MKNDKLGIDGAAAAAAAAAASMQTSFDQGLVNFFPKEYFIQIPVIVIAM